MIKNIKTIFTMQWHGFFENRKQVLMALLFGPMMVFVMLFVMGDISQTDSKIMLYGAEPYRLELTGEDLVFVQGEADMDLIASGEASAIIVVGDDGVKAYYDSSVLRDSAVLYRVQELSDRLTAMMIGSGAYPQFSEAVDVIVTVDISTEGDQVEAVLVPMVSMVFLIGMMLANTSTGSMATDAISGERERGTFDMLRLSGTRVSAIMLGKYAFVVLITLVILVLDVLALVLGLWQFTPELFEIAATQAVKHPMWFLSTLGNLFSMAILTSALYLALSASFENAKQAGAYSSGVQLVLSLMTYASNVVGAGLLAYVPIGNVWVVLGKALNGEATVPYMAVSMAISVAMAVGALWYGTMNLEKEMKK